MNWQVYKAIYDVSLHHHWVGTLFSDIETASIPFMVVVTVGLWLLARPGGSPKWKVAATAALGSAALALGINRLISSQIWFERRPYLTHRIPHPWSSATDASFPSDHASATFAIAFAVLQLDRLGGAVFLVFAVVISAGRLFIGAHYPGDVGAGFLVGLASALVVARLLRPLVQALVRRVERLTDPVLRPVWRVVGK
ncbi:MAG TPA: phosphatase PAP2 family protein [Gaiellaceae bacterium]|nr:phosphatase PAP2 family protein [Gaiellaceae bacterium]